MSLTMRQIPAHATNQIAGSRFTARTPNLICSECASASIRSALSLVDGAVDYHLAQHPDLGAQTRAPGSALGHVHRHRYVELQIHYPRYSSAPGLAAESL